MTVHVVSLVFEKEHRDPIIVVCAKEEDAQNWAQMLITDYSAGNVAVQVEPQYVLGHPTTPAQAEEV